MRRHHQGSGRLPVIPKDWGAAHRPVVAKTWTADVTIRRAGTTGGVFDPNTGATTSATPHGAHHTGKARIQAKPITRTEDIAGDQEITTYGYLVVVNSATSTQTQVGDLVTITAIDDNGDASLVGRELRVVAVARGSLVWERDLLCTDDLG